MPEQTVVAPPAPENTSSESQTPAPDINTQLGGAMWGVPPIVPENPVAPEAASTPPAPEVKHSEEILDSNEWLKTTFGWENTEAAKQELEALRKLKEQAQTPAEHKFANDVSRQYYDAITNGKTDDLYNILHQQKQLERLETMPLTSAKEAAEIIKANLQFKHKDLKPEQIERLFTRQYGMPPQPKQGLDQEDADYAIVLDQWKAQVAEKEQDMIIDAEIAKPELSQYKSQLVLPDIPKPEVPNVPDQEALKAQQEYVESFKQQLYADNKFSGYSVTANDGNVELPISYGVAAEENASFNKVVETALSDINVYLDTRWFDATAKTFKIDQIKADLYLLENRDKVFQAIANKASSQRFEHQLKTQNNIKINGVGGGETSAPTEKSEVQQLGDALWGKK